MAKHLLVSVAKIVGGIAGLVFLFCPLSQIFVLVTSLAVALCSHKAVPFTSSDSLPRTQA